jgi:uncharacterized protein (DUF1697 family)
MHVALLRGINVAGKNKLPMKDLVQIFEAAGCTDVKTFIASGNVIFHAKSVTGLAEKISAAIKKKFQLQVPVVLRTARELEAAADNNPFDDEEKTHLMFLADKPAKSAVGKLAPPCADGEDFAVVGDNVYLYLPHGVGRTKLSNAYFDRALDTVSTLRNYRTVRKLVALAQE